jgi:hypothetical protein
MTDSTKQDCRSKALSLCRHLLKGKEIVNNEDLFSAVDEVLALSGGPFLPCDPPDRDDLLRHLEELYAVFSEDYRILDDRGYRPWLLDRKASIKWRFWNRYRVYLEQEVKLDPDTINKLVDNLTDDILDRLIDPSTPGSWDKRGMVVGQVQSGKTGNYIGLINKAIDAGFRVVVVLAGIHDNLRAQTQIRLDQGVLGADTRTGLSLLRDRPRIGVGLIDTGPVGHPLTTSELKGDFSPKVAGTVLDTDRPVVFVVKKNASVLRHLVLWMAARGDQTPDGRRLVRNAPLLVIDDEADNASINVSKEHVSKINGLIRALLSVFEKRAYVGYTATPFANIFIPLHDEETVTGLNLTLQNNEFGVGQDLFPRDFIINIPPPSNYIGPARVFGMPPLEKADEEITPLDIARTVKDYEGLIPNKHKKNGDLPDQLPESILRAVEGFFLTCAARAARGQTQVHNSMLVHVSRFIRWQDKIASLLDNSVKSYQRRLEFGDQDYIAGLRNLWERKYVPVTEAMLSSDDLTAYRDVSITRISWEDLEPYLWPAVSKIQVRAVHGDNPKADSFYHDISPLDYFEQETRGNYLSVIAVGGDKLSRGLTLEGLSVSYYLRSSRMYDTLMQMGRWFGYRRGYADLCRLFTSKELRDWYRHITIASEELRSEFDSMVEQRRTPRDYGLKIRSHPGVLKITAANKFRHAQTMDLSYSNTLAESYKLRFSDSSPNWKVTEDLLSKLERIPGPARTNKSGHHFYGGPEAFLHIQNFLNNFRVADDVIRGDKMAEYIAAQVPRGVLTEWVVVLLSRMGPSRLATFVINGQKHQVGAFLRTNVESHPDSERTYWIIKNHIISPLHEALDLSQEEFDRALQRTIAFWADSSRTRRKDPPDRPSGETIRSERGERRGLLLLYPLLPTESGYEPVMGYAISFPQIEGDKKITYAVNQQFLVEFDYDDDAEEVLEDA